MTRTFLPALAAGLLLAGAASAQTTLRVGLAEDPDILDPTLARTYVGRIVFASFCDKLFDIDEKLNVVPQLALSHETSPDGKSITIKLRPGVKFHDGEAFDAEAARFSLERHRSMQGSYRRPELTLVDTIEVVDPLTVRLQLKEPFAPMIATLTDRSGMMVSPKAAQASGDKFGLKPVCAGPYKFVERVQQDRIIVEKFADYWNKDNVFIDRIVYQPVTDSTVRLANLQSGSLDIIERMLATDIPRVKGDPKLKLVTVTELGYQGITINSNNSDRAKNPLGQDPRVRRAFELATDRDALNQVVFNGEFKVGNQWVSPDHPYYQSKFPVPKRDVAKAKALLKEAGVKTPITIELMTPQNAEIRQVAEVLQSMTEEAGFKLDIRVTEFATSLKQAEAGNFQAYLLAWSGRTDPDGNIYTFAACGASGNNGHYCNKDVDAALNEGRQAGDVAKRKAAYEKATGILMAEGPVIYLYHRKMLIAHTSRLDGYKQMPDGLVRVVGLKLK